MSTSTLFVDLDGTLITTDTLIVSTRQLLGRRPWSIFMLPFWLLKGRAHLKEQIARRVSLDVSKLPYNAKVLEFINAERAKDRPVVLATAANYRFGQAVAAYLDCFDQAIGSSGAANIKGTEKLKIIRDHIGDQPFDYMGDSMADVPIFAAAAQPIAVNPSAKLKAELEKMNKPFITL